MKPHVVAETATVYRARGRRWLTLKGACKAAAMAKIRMKYCREDIALDADRLMRARDKLAGFYRIRYNQEQRRLSASGAINHGAL